MRNWSPPLGPGTGGRKQCRQSLVVEGQRATGSRHRVVRKRWECLIDKAVGEQGGSLAGKWEKSGLLVLEGA